MAFWEHRISDAIARGSRGGPRSRRTKVYQNSGRLVQNFEWLRPLHSYDLSYGIKTQEDFEQVRAAFMIVHFTPYEGLRMRDWGDYKATRSNTSVLSLGGGLWQLRRRYSLGSINFDRNISKPNSGALVYDAGGTLLTATVDTTTGIATVTGTPTSWVGTFDVPVTFSNDSLENIELDGNEGSELQGLQSIPLEELLL